MDLQRNVLDGVVLMDLGGNSHVVYLENHIARLSGLFFYMEVDVAADHHG